MIPGNLVHDAGIAIDTGVILPLTGSAWCCRSYRAVTVRVHILYMSLPKLSYLCNLLCKILRKFCYMRTGYIHI